MTLVVTQVTTPEELEIAKALRFQVFIDEQGFDGELEVDEHDADPATRHFLGKDVEQDKFVAVSRAMIDPATRVATLGRIAVLQECRGKKYGVVIMQAMEDALKSECDTLKLSAQFDKRGFYAKCGYERLNDEVYLDENVPHCTMVKKVIA